MTEEIIQTKRENKYLMYSLVLGIIAYLLFKVIRLQQTLYIDKDFSGVGFIMLMVLLFALVLLFVYFNSSKTYKIVGKKYVLRLKPEPPLRDKEEWIEVKGDELK